MTIRITMTINIVGIGTIGSHFAMCLAKRGRENLGEVHAYDDDVVEIGNTRTQTYLPKHANAKSPIPKVDALAEQMKERGDVDLIRHCIRVREPIAFAGCVFVGVGKMSESRSLWEGSIRRNPKVSLMIEARLTTTRSLIHVIDPNNETHIKKWEKYWYPDEESSTAGMSCSKVASLGPIGELTANLCDWQLVHAIQGERLNNQIRISMMPLSIETYQW